MAKRSKRKEVAPHRRQAAGKATDAGSGGEWSSGWLRADWVFGAILVLAVFLVYLPAWGTGFVWDDSLLVVDNPCIVGPYGLKEIWTSSAADICPLTLTTFWVEHALWGLAPLPYHVVNVLLHAGAAVVLWRVLRLLPVPGARFGAVLWALHPVQAETVMSVAEMKNTESGLFFLLAVLFFVKWLRAADPERGAGATAPDGWALFFAALSMASKSSTVILPVILCLCAWWIEGRLRRPALVRLAPIFLLALLAGLLSIWTQKLSLATDAEPQWMRTWPERVAGAGDAVWFYLGKLLWPHPLIAIYPRWQIDATRAAAYLPLLAVVIVLAVLWLKRSSWGRPWFFAFATFLVALFPALGLFDNFIFRYSLVFDHLQYLAAIAPLAMVGAGLDRLAHFRPRREPWLRPALAGGCLLGLGLLSRHRALAFTSDETLWTDTLAKNPACWTADTNLGMVSMKEGQVDRAMTQFERALAINPNLAQVRDNLGDALLKEGRTDEAIVQFQRALAINPAFSGAHRDLGNALVEMGEPEEAMAQYQKALDLDSLDAMAHENLGIVLAQRGKTDAAKAQFRQCLQIDPHDAEAEENLGNASAQAGQLDEAKAHYEKALALNPRRVSARCELGAVLQQQGRPDEAMAEYARALEIDPGSVAAHTRLAILLVQKGRWGEAVAHFQAVVDLQPLNAEARANLARAQALARGASR
jgi:tetratricopeptide (TPR) repeat protein